MLAAALAFERMLDGVDRAGAVELARFSLAGDRLLDSGNMLLWVVAVDVLLVADADPGDLWRSARTRAHATGSLFAALAVNLWQGFAQWRSGRLDDALQSLGDATEQSRMWGSAAVGDPFAAAFTAGIQLDRGDLDAAERAVAQRPIAAQDRRGRAAAAACHRPVAARPGPTRGGTGRTGRRRRSFRHRQPGLGAAGGTRPPARWPRSAAATRRWRWPTSRSVCCAGGVRGRRWARRCGWPASSAGAAGVPLLREAVDLLGSTPAALELARARLALGLRPEVDDRRGGAVAARGGRRRPGLRRGTGAATPRWPPWRIAANGRDRTITPPPRASPPASGRVLDLTAAGLDIRQVAQRLFLTPGTVHEVLAAVAVEDRGRDDALK